MFYKKEERFLRGRIIIVPNDGTYFAGKLAHAEL